MAEAIKLKRGLIIEVNLDPTKGSETGKIRPYVGSIPVLQKPQMAKRSLR
jgi:mRNA-degrading endonuclease toxin of MazEF toxin-antitoxin module